jgi:hypothetical protein
VPSGRDAERGSERVEVRGAEDDAAAGGDVDEVEVDPGPRDFACQSASTPRLAAEQAGVEPPQWALQPVPEVTIVGPPIAAQE